MGFWIGFVLVQAIALLIVFQLPLGVKCDRNQTAIALAFTFGVIKFLLSTLIFFPLLSINALYFSAFLVDYGFYVSLAYSVLGGIFNLIFLSVAGLKLIDLRRGFRSAMGGALVLALLDGILFHALLVLPNQNLVPQ